MIDFIPALIAGAFIGAFAVALPDIVSDLLRIARLRRAERAVVRTAEQFLRVGPHQPA
jgi:hypothetical protein